MLRQGAGILFQSKGIAMQITLKTDVLAIANDGRSMVLSYKEDKKGLLKTGSFARALAFASREVRHDAARSLYVKYLSNGQYRPIVTDVTDVLVPASARAFVLGAIGTTGGMSKDAFISFCRTVKAAMDSTGKEPKGQKLFFYGLVSAIVNELDDKETVIDSQ
jgi:hypothetical protein